VCDHDFPIGGDRHIELHGIHPKRNRLREPGERIFRPKPASAAMPDYERAFHSLDHHQ
jgi:hypothetical protein